MTVADRLSVEMRALLDRIAREDGDLPDRTLLPAELGRAQFEAVSERWNRELAPMHDVVDHVFDTDEGAIASRLFVPVPAPEGGILFVHGGGWAFGSIRTHEAAIRLLAEASGLAVLAIDYRLAPEHPYPCGLHDVLATGKLLASVSDMHRVGCRWGIAGDSAGANLAMACMLRQVETIGHTEFAFSLLFYGCFAPELDSRAHQMYGTGFGLTTAKMRRFFDWYAPGEHRYRFDVSPLLAPDALVATLPPTYLLAAELDPLRDDTVALHSRLNTLKVETCLRRCDGVVHGFLQMANALQSGQSALRGAARWARSHI